MNFAKTPRIAISPVKQPSPSSSHPTVNSDDLVKNPKLRHSPVFALAGSVKAGIQKYLKALDSAKVSLRAPPLWEGATQSRPIKSCYDFIHVTILFDNKIAVL